METKPLPVRDGFGHIKRPEIVTHCNARYLTQYQYVPNHESLGFDLTSDGVEPVDLVAQTQSYKKECGMEAMRILLAAGQKTPADFADDGNSSGDSTQFPTNINDAYQASVQQKDAAAKAVASLGGSLDAALSSGNLEDYIKGLVLKQIEAVKAKEPAKEVKENA